MTESEQQYRIEQRKRREELSDLVKRYHGSQNRKYTGDPYWIHLQNVTITVQGLDLRGFGGGQLAGEIALCHDLLEDTSCDVKELMSALKRIGYSAIDANTIVAGVIELTDVYTHKNYPHLNRRDRKILEARRLGRISPLGQTIKYADMIDNTLSIVRHDPGFAKTYLQEKKMYLDHMREGHIDLLLQAAWHLSSGLRLLEADVKPNPELRASAKHPATYSEAIPPVESDPELWGLWCDLNRRNPR